MAIDYPKREIDIVAWACDGFMADYDLVDEALTCLKYLREQGADDRYMPAMRMIEERI